MLAAGGIISAQVLNELISVSRHKQGRSWDEIDEALGVLKILLDPPQPVTMELHEAAVRIARNHNFSINDGLIVAAALQARSSVLYSEDLQHGQKIGRLTVQNPFV